MSFHALDTLDPAPSLVNFSKVTIGWERRMLKITTFGFAWRLMAVPDYTVEAVVSRPFEQVAYIVWGRGVAEAVVVDPGFDTDSLLERLQRHRLGVAAILNTHGHVDHIVGNRAMKEAYSGAELVIGANEAALLRDPAKNMSASFGVPITSPDADRLVVDGERIEVAGLEFEVREIPGHSPGSVVYLCDRFDPMFVLGGDVLFQGSIGRTDIGGDLSLLLAGIRTRLLSLPDQTIVYPGHGPVTTIGHERRSNPFVGVTSGGLEVE
jgi:glyoxylase-like metal-dependent hydrolase (beta-lactamase superfamily II)